MLALGQQVLGEESRPLPRDAAMYETSASTSSASKAQRRQRDLKEGQETTPNGHGDAIDQNTSSISHNDAMDRNSGSNQANKKKG